MTVSRFLPKCKTTAIGSLPLADAQEACALLLDDGLDIPFWPQLPKRDFRELMNPQYSEGMPCLKIDEAEKRIWFQIDDTKADSIMHFYEQYMAGDPSAFKLSPAFALGFHTFIDEAKKRDRHFELLKGQVTGPLTFSLGVTDQERKAAYYDFELQDAIAKCLALKAIWQVRELKPLCEQVIIFIDEPVLAAFGTSAYLSLTGDDVIRLLGELNQAIKPTGAVTGVHCCGNTDWSVLCKTGVDIISFDAYEYCRSISLYPDEIKTYLEQGGILAWGIVPTNESIRQETPQSLKKRLLDGFALLEAKGIPREIILNQALLTPSCGTGSMQPDDSRKVFSDLVELGSMMQTEVA